MTTLRQLRKAALSLPGTEEETHRSTVSFTVRGKDFASVEGGLVRLRMSDADAEAALAEHPQGERLVRRGTPIGRPATRALLGAGITTLDEVAARSQADLIALHGVGPRAVRVLGEALADRGVDWPVR